MTALDEQGYMVVDRHGKEGDLVSRLRDLAHNEAVRNGWPSLSKLLLEAAGRIAHPQPQAGGEEVVERVAKAYADATGYYVQFHRGLSSPSADKIREGIRAALKALSGEAQ